MDYEKMMENVPEGLGLEEVSAEDVQRSRLALVQGPPQTDEDDDSFIEGAKRGQVFDTVLGVSWNSVEFICVHYKRRWYEWSPSGSLVNIHDKAVPHDENFLNEKGNKISLTAVFSGFVLEPNSGDRHVAFVALSSTQLKKAKPWITLANREKFPNGMKAPLFWRVWRLSGTKEFGLKGPFYGWVIKRKDTIEDYANRIEEKVEALIKNCVDLNATIKEEHTRYLKSGFKGNRGNLIPAESSAAFEKDEKF